jgi:nucleoside phosphorylase
MRIKLSSPSSSERGREWTLEYTVEAQGSAVTDLSLTLEHPRLEAQTWASPLQTLEVGNRRVRSHILVTSKAAIAPNEDLGAGTLVARFADAVSSKRWRQSMPVQIRHLGTLDLASGGAERLEPDVARAAVEKRSDGVEVEQYHGFTIRSEPGTQTGPSYYAYWFHVDQADEPVFEVEMRVARLYARRQDEFADTEDATTIASVLGRRWTHGLIHLERFERGTRHEVVRGPEWRRPTAATLSHDVVRRELLLALRRMLWAQENTSAVLDIDVPGIADVLELPVEQVRRAIRELITLGLAEPFMETLGHGAAAGACRITGAGLRVLEEQRPTEPAMARPSQPAGALKTAVVLTALRVEYQAVRAHLADIHEQVHPKGTIYERGTLSAAGQTWDVAIVEVGAGNAGAAAEAERAIQHFDPSVAMFVGVAGGIKDVGLGDVVAVTKAYGYHAGKAGEAFQPRPDVGQSTYDLVQRARAEARKPDWLRRLTGVTPTPNVVVAPIAAGEQVVASVRSATYQFVRANYSDAVAVEMEGRGFLHAVSANQRVSALIVRGISDLLDDKAQTDAAGWQQIAARHASAFAVEVLAKLGVAPPHP